MPRVCKLASAIAGAALLASGAVQALTLGDISLKSALDQPLDAEIELLDARGLPITDVRPDLATAIDFSKIGIPRHPHLEGLRFRPVQQPNGRFFIHVTSDKPISEPYLNFLVEVRWPSGRLLREYTLLLDAPIYAQNSSASMPRLPVVGTLPKVPSVKSMGITLPEDSVPMVPSAPSKPVTKPLPAPTVPVVPPAPKVAAVEIPTLTDVVKPSEVVAINGDEYQTQRNDTLWEIARQMRPNRALTVQQTMLAIQQLNPDAFHNGNINRLKVGQILRLPDEQQIRAVNPIEARNEVQRQHRERNSRGAHAPLGTDVPRTLDATPEQPKSELPVVASPKDDALHLLSVDGGHSTRGSETAAEGTGQGIRNKLALAEEQLSTSRRENQELTERLADLQGQLDTLQRLIELKDSQVARLQADIAGANPVPKTEKTADSAALVSIPTVPAAKSAPSSTAVSDAQVKALSEVHAESTGSASSWLLGGGAVLGGLAVAVALVRRRRRQVPLTSSDLPDESLLQSHESAESVFAAERLTSTVVAPMASQVEPAAAKQKTRDEWPDDAELGARISAEMQRELPELNDRATEEMPPESAKKKEAAPIAENDEEGDAAFEAFMANSVRPVIRPFQEMNNKAVTEASKPESHTLAAALEAAQKLEQARDGLARGETTQVRALLEAVLRDGDSQQQQEARALLGRLG